MLPENRKLGYRTLRRPGALAEVTPVEVPAEPRGTTEFAPGRVYVSGLDGLERKPYGKPARSMAEKARTWLAWTGVEAEVGDAGLCHRTDAGTVRAFAEIKAGDRVGYCTLAGDLPSRPVKVGKRTVPETIPLDEIDRIVIKSGPCLLSGPGFTLSTEGGRYGQVLDRATTGELASPVDAFDWTPGPTLYEVESCRRQAWLMSLIAKGLLARKPSLEVEFLLNIPNTGYDLYFLPGALNGYIPIGLYRDLTALWDGRAALVEGLLRESLVKEGVGSVTTTSMDDLDIVGDVLRDELHAGRVPDLATLFERQFRSGGEIWQAIGETGSPTDVHQAASMGYVHAVLKGSMAKDPSSKRSLLIGVENASEGRIKAEADRMAQAIRSGESGLITDNPELTFDNVAFHPYEGVHASTEGDPDPKNRLCSLYFNEPGLYGLLNGQPVDIPGLLM